MSLLAIVLPNRPRPASAVEPAAASRPTTPGEWSFLFSRDGRTVDQEGQATAAALPKAERVVLVAPDDEVAWLPARLPKVAASRLREVLSGALEEQLLEDPGSTHLALSKAGLQEGQTTWVAALHKPWLEQQLRQLREAGVEADALVAMTEPSDLLQGHARNGSDGLTWAVVTGPHGVAGWPLSWAGWKARLDGEVLWTAEPAAARALTECGFTADRLVSANERLLAAAASSGNLLQFDLAPRMKGSRAVLAAWANFKDRRYRAVQVGLLGLFMVQILGLNANAWRVERELQSMRAQGEVVLRQAFPNIKVVVDPLVQMEREIQSLRQVSGQPGPTDLETWVDVVAALWGGQTEPLATLQLTPQGLTLEASQWPAEVVSALEDYARQHGWQVRLEGNTLKLSNAPAGR